MATVLARLADFAMTGEHGVDRAVELLVARQNGRTQFLVSLLLAQTADAKRTTLRQIADLGFAVPVPDGSGLHKVFGVDDTVVWLDIGLG